MNLAVNARDAMPKGGVLSISTSLVSQPGPRPGDAGGLPQGRYVLLTVSDTGTGMSQEVLSHLFEPFFTTKERSKGTGLGLPMIYGLIKQCGGDISAKSALGQGTTWSILLPAAPETAAQAEAPPAPDASARPPARGTETILLVEDEPAVLTFSRRTLAEARYTVLAASSGKEALQALACRKEPVHLLLTDVIMPGMDDRTLSGRVSRLRPGIQTVFMSGYTDDIIGEHAELASRSPRDSYLQVLKSLLAMTDSPYGFLGVLTENRLGMTVPAAGPTGPPGGPLAGAPPGLRAPAGTRPARGPGRRHGRRGLDDGPDASSWPTKPQSSTSALWPRTICPRPRSRPRWRRTSRTAPRAPRRIPLP